MSIDTLFHPEADIRPRPDGRGRWGGARLIRSAIGSGVAIGLAAVAVLAAVLASDPVVLARLGGRLEATRAGAEFLGRDGLTLQTGLHDCGPAALANLLASLGQDPPPLGTLARLAGTRPSGTRTSGLVRAAGRVGVSLSRWTGSSATGPSQGPEHHPPFPLPAIAWVHESHFVTVASQAPDGRLTILDPLVGRYSMTTADFRGIWSGEVLLVPQEDPPLVATPVAAPFPLAGGFHAKSILSPAHLVPRRQLRDAPSRSGA